MSLVTWSWLFLLFYIGLMLLFGLLGKRRIKNADDFATARGSYSAFVLALAYAASTASGSTFLGSPGLSYEFGLASIWSKFLYPLGVYFGVLISMRLIATSGNRFGNRSIPEYLGMRYQSDGIRIVISILSLLLLFYLAGQLVSGIVMFETMLGVSPQWAIIITTTVLLIYVLLGGAHADILTDSAQGLMMLFVAVVVIILFLTGAGIDDGLPGLVNDLESQDKNLVGPLNYGTPLLHSWWSIAAIFLSHIPLGLLPHLGNKLWALEEQGSRLRFVKLAFCFGLVLAMMGLGGLLARVLFADALYADGLNPNQALPLLFIELFPSWLAALIGVGILSAIMSTADGLVVSSSQIIANDLYRLTFVPLFRRHITEAELDRRVLLISRLSTGAVLLICMFIAWMLQDKNISLIIWIGSGGMMAALAGPLVVGALWRGVTKSGAYAGMVSGFLVFIILHMQLLEPAWFNDGPLLKLITWLYGEGPNPFSCAALGEIVSVTATIIVSRFTRTLPDLHIKAVFGDMRPTVS